MEKIGYIGVLPDNSGRSITKKGVRRKRFLLSYSTEDMKLYSYARLIIRGQIIETNKALWDTGATITAISRSKAREIGSKPAEAGTVYSATDQKQTDIYMAEIELPGGIIFKDVEVWKIGLEDLEAEIIIGMNIISQGRFLVENEGGIPVFSFEVEN